MRLETSLATLNFEAIRPGVLTSVQCSLTNGNESDVFRNTNQNGECEIKKTLNFETSPTVRGVAAYGSSLKLLDEADEVILELPVERAQASSTFNFGENEELIGVFGCYS